MIETARRIGIPLIGHAPGNLSIDDMLQARQSLAHLGTLDNIWFLPFRSHVATLLASAVAILLLICMALTSLGTVVLRRWWKKTQPADSIGQNISRMTGFIALAAVAAFICAFTYLPGGPLFDSTFSRLAFTVLGGIITAATFRLGFSAIGLLRRAGAPVISKMKVLLAITCAAALSGLMLSFWVPVSWRSSDGGIDRLAKQVHEAGIFVQSTLVVYETANTRGRAALINDLPLISSCPKSAKRGEASQYAAYH
jgi:hypothetical protein